VKMLALAVLLATLRCVAQDRSAGPVTASDSKAEALVSCSEGLQLSPEFTPYGFAKTALVSLWYARNGAKRGIEVKQAAKETDNMFSYLTAMMRITKTSTNDFICAKRSLKPFAAQQNDGKVKTASDFMIVVYDAHISINTRLIQLLKRLDRTDQADVMDEISTLQVERGQRWADLVEPTELALMMLVDLKRTDIPGKTTRLVITRAQKQRLFDWINDHFPEFMDGTPKDQWSDPAKTAQLYLIFLNSRKCADE
jgi:hypothetical protein